MWKLAGGACAEAFWSGSEVARSARHKFKVVMGWDLARQSQATGKVGQLG